MRSSSQQSFTALPNGSSTSSTNTRNSKLEQIIQNFYTKTAQIIVQARCTPNNDSRYGKRNSLKGSSSSRKLNKWFNIATEDVEVLREDLKFWRNSALQAAEREPPPMIIDIYLDTSKLSHNQPLVVADDNLRWGGVELKSQTSDAHIDRILIESWELTLKHPSPDHAVDLPNLYKRSIVFFRTLHSLVHLLPSYDLYRELHKHHDSSNALSIGYRLSSAIVQNNTEIPIGSTILENDARKPTLDYKFTDVVTPIGTFKLNVTYRRNCDFRVEDSERDLSAQFIDMDEHFFTPTMAKYQQQEYTRPRPVSAYTPSSNRRESLLDDDSNRTKMENSRRNFSTSPIHPSEQREFQSQHQTSTNTITGSTPKQTTSSHALNRAESVLSTSRRSSAPFVVSPFKSPFLSSSPQAESFFSGAGSSGARHFTPSTSEKTRSGGGGMNGGGGGGVDSGSFGRKIEFSSSFDKYKASPTNRTAADSPSSNSMTRRWSRTSDHSSINFKSENDDDLEDFVRFVGSNQELRLFQNKNSSTQLFSSGHNMSSESDTTNSSITGSMSTTANRKTVLSHFQNLRETHNSLSESLTSSMMLGNASSSSQQDPVSGISPVSSTSSTGRSYQPIIPSPLHAEQRSTSPVHIPRSFPQLRTLANNQNALRLTRINNPSNYKHEDEGFGDDAINDISAYSTYPQDYHNQDLHMMRNAVTTSNSTRMMGRAIINTPPRDRAKSPVDFSSHRLSRNYDNEESLLYNLQRSRNVDGSMLQGNSINSSGQGVGGGKNSSMMDDDDSLVFKMSELEFEGPQQQSSQSSKDKQQPMLFNNNRYNTKVDFNNPTNVSSSSSPSSTTPTTNRPLGQQDHFIELTPTPLSPPLLHRLQAISMSTVNEEEEKSSSLSASGSSSKSTSDSPNGKKPKTSTPRPFDAW